MSDSSDPVRRDIVAARISLLLNYPFFGSLASNLELVDASKWCKTAATDGRKLYYNREFIKSLSRKELLFLLAHEVLHCVYDHLGRKGGREHEIWNMANDYIVNYTLVKEKIGEMPKGGLYDARYTDEMISEQVYNLLMQNSVKVQATLDEHLSGLGNGDDSDGNGGSGNTVSVTVVGGPDGPPKLTEEDMQNIRNEIVASVISTANIVGAGSVPAGVRRLIQDLTQPVMDWRELLTMHIKSAMKDDFTFTKPSRRSWSYDGEMSVILPGQDYKETIDIAVSIDTSGSMTDEMLRDFLSEVKGIMESFADFRLILWTFDCRVYNPVVFTPSNIDEIMSYDPKGGGGTTFECNWEFMKDPASMGFNLEGIEGSIEPKKFVMFTDGYPNYTWGDENYCDTLFVIHGNTEIVAPFGLTAYYVKPN